MRPLPRSSVSVSGGYSVLAECGQDGGVGYVEMLCDAGEGPSELVEVDGGLDLFGGQAVAAHGHMVPVEDSADRAPFDIESGGQFIHGGSGLVFGDQFRDSVGVELPCASRFGPLGGCRGVGQLLDQGLQGFYLRFRVVVRSPKVHVLIQVRTGIAPVLTCFICADPTFTPRFRPNVFIMLGDVWEGGCS